MEPGRNVAHAIRVLRRRPGFTVCTILLLALGIGANTAVFSIVRGVLLRPLPYANLDRLTFIWGGLENIPGNRHAILTGNDAERIRQSATTLESFALVKGWQTGIDGQMDLILADGAERLEARSSRPISSNCLASGDRFRHPTAMRRSP